MDVAPPHRPDDTMLRTPRGVMAATPRTSRSCGSTPRRVRPGAPATIVAPPRSVAENSQQLTINDYAHHTVKCNCEDRGVGARIAGHTWNILSNADDTEVYMQHVRNKEHFVTDDNVATRAWWARKKRCNRKGDSTHYLDSRPMDRSLKCPPTAGREAARLQKREIIQLCQSGAPADYALYSTRRFDATPRTPERAPHTRTVPFQERQRDLVERPTPRLTAKTLFTPRRGELREERKPPRPEDMFSTPNQIRNESVIDVVATSFARDNETRRATGTHPRITAAASKTLHSADRLESIHTREVSTWHIRNSAEKLLRDDNFHMKPMQRTGNSSVKYDILSNDRKDFWY